MRWKVHIVGVVVLMYGAIFAQTPQLGSIEGIVVDSVTNAPITGVVVRTANPGFPDSTATTTREGRFVLAGVIPGEHRIVASKPGFLNDRSANVRVVLDTGQQIQSIVYRMTPAGVITGRVVDDEGRPMRGARVHALAYGYREGERQLIPQGNAATTNDRGEFRVFWLDPGAYHVVVNPSGWYIPTNTDSRFIMTYYPGASDFPKSEVVQIASGEHDIRSIQMATAPTRNIRGRIVGAIPAPPDMPQTYNFAITLQSLAEVPYQSSAEFPITVERATQRFELKAGIEPGPYRATARYRTPFATFVGSTKINVDRDDLEDVQIPIQKNLTVLGQVRFEGSETTQTPLSVTCVPDQLSADLTATATVRGDGRFSLDGVFPNRYSVQLKGLPDDAYLAGVTVQSREAEPGSVEFPSVASNVNLSLTVKHDGGKVSGIVMNAESQPQSGATIVFFPESAFRSRLDLYKSAESNTRGEFQMRGLAPGNYTVLAFKHLEAGAFQSSRFLEDFENQGVRLAVISGGDSQLSLTPIP